MKQNTHLRFTWRSAVSFLLLTLTLVRTPADELEPLWTLAPGDRPYITSGVTERGLAYNPATDHVLVVSRAAGNPGVVYILDAATGVELGTLNMGTDPSIFAGTFNMSMIGVTQDGVIYVANLSNSTAAADFRLYRWESETAAGPILAFAGDPAWDETTGASRGVERWGDSFDVRGAGQNVQILAGARNGSVATVVSTTDGVNHSALLISNAGTAGMIGVAFGEGNTIWTKLNNQPVRHVSFHPESGEGTHLRDYDIAPTIAPMDVNVASNWLGGISINAGADQFFLYTLGDLTQDPVLVDSATFPADNSNNNNVGTVDLYQDLVYALDTQNGLLAFRVVPSVDPPTIASHPESAAVVEGGFYTLTATISGTAPFTYQWSKDGDPIPDATGPALTFSSMTAEDVGTYSLAVENAAGSATSNDAIITFEPSVRSSRATLLWQLAPGDLTFLTTSSTERGLAYNKATGNLLVISRTSGGNVHVLNGDTGEYLYDLQAPTDVVSGSDPSGFRLNMIGVADDGVVFAANLDNNGSTGQRYTIYRWDNDSADAIPTIAYRNSGELTDARYGDTFDVRGEGLDTQLLAAFNQTTTSAQPNPPAVFVVFNTFDGFTFFANRFEVPDAPAGSPRLGLTFGEGDTAWAKSPNYSLYQFSFDLTTFTAATLNIFPEFPASIAPIGFHPSSNLLAAISLATPDNLHLYDMSDLTSGPLLIDQDFFPTDNNNGNGTGSIDFAGDRLYALASNNGILALQLNPPAPGGDPAELANPELAGETFSFTLTGSPNTDYEIEGSSDFESWTDLTTVTTDASGSAQVSDNPLGPYRFYRAVTGQ